MSDIRRDPYRKVSTAVLKNDNDERLWQLTLECGHEDTRRVKYDTAKGNAGRGGSRKKPVRRLEEALPPPSRARCDQCSGRSLFL